jgi:hypothetical protein
MRRIGSLSLVLALSSLGACQAGRRPPAPVAHVPVAKGSLTLEAANARWQGASCELTVPLQIKGSPDDEGWHGSGKILINQPGTKRFYMYFAVTDPQAAGIFYSGKAIQPGARLTSRGWRLQRPDEQKGPYLDLQFERSTARARLQFQATGSFSSANFPLDRLAEVEQYVRLNLLRVAFSDEELVDVPSN